ncbi:uncharacterized protein C8orf74-like [Patiria miniata]|uniref:Uncharacterized protein n=1 Tax=Patiria miniata TaxID=46514 RepID=A0A914A2J5_PATMI|nr:uncharacterized protein C8orf74-like [Patiria miniata]
MAASMSPEEAEQVALLPKPQGRLKLAQCLRWDLSGFSEEDHMRESILLDYLHDSLLFAAGRGFPLHQVCGVLNLAREMQEQTIGQPLSHAIRLYRQKSVEYAKRGRISDKNLKIFTSHFFATFMRHYRLYQFVFTRPRDPMVSQLGLEVQPPPDTFELKESKPEHIWQYNQKLAAIENEERTRMESLQLERDELLRQEPDTNEPLCALNEAGAPLQEEVLSRAIREATSLQGTYTERLLQARVEETHEDMDYYFEKTALPRPAALGPPPRSKSPPRAPARSKTASTKSGGTGGKNSLGSALPKGSAKSLRSKTPKSVKS